MKFQGFVGPTYKLDSVNVDCQRCVNLYPEVIESGTGKEGQIAYLKSTPGLRKLFTVGTGPIRLVQYDDPVKDPLNPPNRAFVVSGNQVYRCIYYDVGGWELTLLGTIGTSTGPVRAASLKIDLGITVFVDGQNSYLYWRYNTGDAHATESFGLFSAYGYPAVPLATHVIQIDSYLIYNQGKTNTFFVSDFNTFTIDALNFASAEGSPDDIVAIISTHRLLWLIKQRTIEVWADTGNSAFPFERITGGFIEVGCVAASSVAKVDGKIFWLGQEESGSGMVYMTEGLVPSRISTHAVEAAIRSYADMSTATAYTYQSGGHFYYVLNFAEATWVFDYTTKLWHERAYTNAGDLERHRGECVSFFAPKGFHLVGDYQNGNVYQFDESYHFDDTAQISRMRVTPHVSNSKQKLFCHKLELDMETGVGLVSGQGSDPQVMLQWSDDGGHTWSDEMWTSAGGKIGGIGDFKKRPIWRRLGKFYDRVFKILITDPVPVTLLGAEIDVEPGSN